MKKYNRVFKSVHHKYTIRSMLGMNIHVLNKDSCSVNEILLKYTERFLDGTENREKFDLPFLGLDEWVTAQDIQMLREVRYANRYYY